MIKESFVYPSVSFENDQADTPDVLSGNIIPVIGEGAARAEFDHLRQLHDLERGKLLEMHLMFNQG